jgi:hypothetical protein
MSHEKGNWIWFGIRRMGRKEELEGIDREPGRPMAIGYEMAIYCVLSRNNRDSQMVNSQYRNRVIPTFGKTGQVWATYSQL